MLNIMVVMRRKMLVIVGMIIKMMISIVMMKKMMITAEILRGGVSGLVREGGSLRIFSPE